MTCSKSPQSTSPSQFSNFQASTQHKAMGMAPLHLVIRIWSLRTYVIILHHLSCPTYDLHQFGMVSRSPFRRGSSQLSHNTDGLHRSSSIAPASPFGTPKKLRAHSVALDPIPRAHSMLIPMFEQHLRTSSPVPGQQPLNQSTSRDLYPSVQRTARSSSVYSNASAPRSAFAFDDVSFCLLSFSFYMC